MGLVWRRGGVGFGQKAESNLSNPSFAGVVGAGNFGFSILRVALFVGAHGLILLTCKLLHETLGPFVGTFSFAGWVTAALKMSVLLPTLLLLPLNRWRILARIYAAEGVAALVVLFTFFPSRIAGAIWPWYGQVLGRMVFFVSGLLAPGLTLETGLTPTIHGPDLDVTILFSCSGISGVELFDYLFGMVVFVDWNRLRKGRVLFVYFAGIAAMLAGNGLRIVSFVVLGNRGFADSVSRFHLSAGWLFFSAVFLAYLSLTYRWILEPAEDRN
jgi:exosortase/archaeosortase family protein